MDKKFDLFISIGNLCASTESLRKCQLQFYTYPLDWVAGGEIIHRTKLIASGCADFINRDSLKKIADNMLSKPPKAVYTDTSNQLVFNHDFPLDKTLDESFGKIKAKYDRRSSRLVSQIEQSENVLFIWIDSLISAEKTHQEKIIEAYNILKEAYGDKVSMLALVCDHSLTFENRVDTMIYDDLRLVKFDYDGYNELPHIINNKGVIAIFNQFRMTNKFLTRKNRFHRFLYYTKLFFMGKLWKKI